MPQVFRRIPPAPPSALAKFESPAKEDSRKSHIASLEETISKLRAQNLALRTELENQNRFDERNQKLLKKIDKAMGCATRSARAASHWWYEAHRLADGRPIRHQFANCKVCKPDQILVAEEVAND